jgi:hypothetical protein
MEIFPGDFDIGGKIACRYIYASREKLLCEVPHFMSLIEYEPHCCIWRRNTLRFMHKCPQVFMTLQSVQEIGLGQNGWGHIF